jgi:hypothetical protein
MNTSIAIQETGLWEAWIEFDHLDSNDFGTLYILGEAPINIKSKTSAISKIDGENSSCLVLKMPALPGTGRFKTKEVLYSEKVQKIDQYHAIVVYQGEELITEITDIEVLV